MIGRASGGRWNQWLRSRWTRPGRTAVAAVAALAAAAGLAACSNNGAGSSAAALIATPHPIVLGNQAEQILSVVGSAVDQAVAAPAGTPAGPRLIGPTLAAETALRRLPAGLRSGVPVGTQTWTRLIVTAQTGWPRWFLAVGTAPSSPTPLLSLLYSGSARAPYGLWAQLTMLPGQQLPEVAPAGVGAPTLTGSAPGLVVAPGLVAVQYADVLNRGAASSYARAFAPDLFARQVGQQLAHDQAAFLKYGTVSAHQSAVPLAALALRTRDGGALVIAELAQSYQVRVRPSAGTVQVDPALAALAGRARFAQQVTRTSQEIVAFVIPPQGSGGQIRVVAAAKTDLSASGS